MRKKKDRSKYKRYKYKVEDKVLFRVFGTKHIGIVMDRYKSKDEVFYTVRDVNTNTIYQVGIDTQHEFFNIVSLYPPPTK